MRYADAWRHESTPWPGRLEVAPENSHVLPGGVKDKWTRTVYFDFGGQEDELDSMNIGLGHDTDLFKGINMDGGPISRFPLSHIGVGLEYGCREQTDLTEMTDQKSWRRIAWELLSKLRQVFWRRARM